MRISIMEAVGLTTFGSLENNGGLAAGLNFAVPVTILNEYIDSANIDAQPGKATRRFNQGLAKYSRHEYFDALQEFEAVLKLNSHYPGIYYYIVECRENIKNGRGRSVGSVERMLFIVVLLLAVGGAIVLLVINRRKAD